MAYKRKIRVPKKTNWINYLAVSGLLLFFLVGISLYLLPFVRYYQLEQAIAARDAGAVINYLNPEELKANLIKRHTSISLHHKGDVQNSPLCLVDLAVKWNEQVSTPEYARAFTTQGLYAIMAELGKEAPEEEGVLALASRIIKNSSFEYQSLDRFSIKAKDLRGRFVGYVNFHFSREGFNWQLVDVQFPLF